MRSAFDQFERAGQPLDAERCRRALADLDVAGSVAAALS
jgi:hypothetical protein